VWLKWVIGGLSAGVRRRAKHRGIDFAFLFMQPNGAQLRDITRLIEMGAIRPVIDKVFPFEQTPQALACVEAGRAKGKVVISVH
jgi:alcohol dehydrogenase